MVARRKRSDVVRERAARKKASKPSVRTKA
ncbi:hypothetical protein LCGC14_2438220, partial [marine sediment metagenome]